MRIHITGASGSCTSTLGRAVAGALGAPFVDADDCYWLPTETPFTVKRAPDERLSLLRAREIERLGHVDQAFLTWAAQYDDGPPDGRSLAKHRAWLAERRCMVLELRGDQSVADRLAAVLAACEKLFVPPRP